MSKNYSTLILHEGTEEYEYDAGLVRLEKLLLENNEYKRHALVIIFNYTADLDDHLDVDVLYQKLLDALQWWDRVVE